VCHEDVSKAMPETYDDLIGLPYKLGATGPDEYDCFGIVMEVLARMGFPLEFHNADEWIRRYKPGETDPNEVTLHECEVDGPVPRKPGDILIMRGPEAPNHRATHVGVMIGENLVMQSTRKLGVHIVPFRNVEQYTVEVITWID
jgi:cell wall-associated NlpC family hydrolase